MSHTVSRGIVTESHYRASALRLYEDMEGILVRGHTEKNSILPGARRSISRLLDAALSGIQMNQGVRSS